MRRWISKSYLALVIAFLYLPIAVLIVFSFNDSKSRSVWTGFTFDWYKELFNNSLILDALKNTLIIAAIATVVSTVIGTIAAIGINKMNKNLKSVVMNVTYLPIINPEIVTGVSLMLLFVFLRNIIKLPIEAGFTTLVLAHITFCIPYVILNVMPKLRQLDNSIFEAAQDLGCSPSKTLLKVIVPEIMPGIITGAMIAFTMSLDDFVISYFVSGPTSQTLPIAIYSMTRKRISPEINALSTIIFVVVLLILFISNYMDIKREESQFKKSRD